MSKPNPADPKAIRRYWTDQMEAGLAFVGRVLDCAVADDGEQLLDIPACAYAAGVELRCSERPHAVGRPRIFRVRAALIDPLLAAAQELRERGHTLVVEDAFRTREMQRDLAVTDAVLDRLLAALRRIEPDAPPSTVIERLSVVVAARPKGAGHMAGAAVDVTVLAPDGQPLDRGGRYLTVSEAMPMASPFVSARAAGSRAFVTDVMRRHGFTAYPFEFWHYSRDDAFDRVASGDPRPARYGPLDLRDDGQTAPVPALDQRRPLHDDSALLTRLASLAQRGESGLTAVDL